MRQNLKIILVGLIVLVLLFPLKETEASVKATFTPYIWIPYSEGILQIKTSDGSFVSKFENNSYGYNCTANCNTNYPSWTARVAGDGFNLCPTNAFIFGSLAVAQVAVNPNGDVWTGRNSLTRLGKKAGCSGDQCYECKNTHTDLPGPISLTFDRNGNLWAGFRYASSNSGNDICKYKLDGTKDFCLQDIITATCDPWHMMSDCYGNIWLATALATSDRVCRIEIENCDTTSCPVIDPAWSYHNIESIDLDNEGDVWIANNNLQEVSEVDGSDDDGGIIGNRTTTYSVPVVTGDRAAALAVDGNNNIWVGSDASNKIYVLRPDGTFVDNATCVGGSVISSMSIDAQNNGWVVSPGWGPPINIGYVWKIGAIGGPNELTVIKEIQFSNFVYEDSDMTGFRTTVGVNCSSPPPCTYLSCENANPTLPCSCGSATANAINPWCCAADNKVSNSEAACKVGACAPPPPSCTWYNDGCGKGACLSTEMRQICSGQPGCSGGCPPGATRCITHLACTVSLADASTCLCSGEIEGGLVPCGRKTNDPNTDICECCPCTICHFFVLGKRVIDFLFKSIILPLVLLMIIISGVKFITAISPEKINEAKMIFLAAIVGFFITFSAWLIINSLLSFMVQRRPPTFSEAAKIFSQPWHQLSCTPGKVCITSICGNGTVEYGEECDGNDLNGKTCSDFFGFTSGTLKCDDECHFDFTSCGRCGDGIVQDSEECEPALFSLTGETCADFGFDEGTLECTNDCKYDTSLCWKCGDRVVQGPEECEIGQTQTCTGTFTEGLPSYCRGIPVTGTKSCKNDCTWDDCVLGTPTITSHSSTACAATSPSAEDYACCELTSCSKDACECCGRSWGAATPSGYTTLKAMDPCDISPGNQSCKLNQSDANPRNWIITTEHTTAYYQCWK